MMEKGKEKRPFETGSRIAIEYSIPPGGHEIDYGFLQEMQATLLRYDSVFGGTIIMLNLLSSNLVCVRTLTKDEDTRFTALLKEYGYED